MVEWQSAHFRLIRKFNCDIPMLNRTGQLIIIKISWWPNLPFCLQVAWQGCNAACPFWPFPKTFAWGRIADISWPWEQFPHDFCIFWYDCILTKCQTYPYMVPTFSSRMHTMMHVMFLLSNEDQFVLEFGSLWRTLTDLTAVLLTRCFWPSYGIEQFGHG